MGPLDPFSPLTPPDTLLGAMMLCLAPVAGVGQHRSAPAGAKTWGERVILAPPLSQCLGYAASCLMVFLLGEVRAGLV